MFTYPRFRMVMMLTGIGFWLYTLYGFIGQSFVWLGDFADWIAKVIP